MYKPVRKEPTERDIDPGALTISEEKDLDHREFEEIYAGKRPVLLSYEPYSLLWLADWTPSRLVGRLGDQPVRVLENPYQSRASQTAHLGTQRRTLEMPLDEFVHGIFLAATSSGRYLELRLAFEDPTIGEALLPAPIAPNTILRPIAKERSGVWLATEGVRNPMHVSRSDELLAGISGTKVAYLFPPTHVRQTETISQLRRVSDSQEDVIRLSDTKQIPRYRASMRAGRMLYIPGGWAHDVLSLTNTVMAVLRFD